MIDSTLDYKLDRWVREARELATCVACYGVGEDRDAPGRACRVCSGRGRAAREPHVLELVALLRLEQSSLERAVETRLDAEVEAGELRLEVDRLRGDLCRLRAELYRLRRREED